MAKTDSRELSGRDAMVSVGVVACLAAMVTVINADVLAGNWRWDDASILLHLHQYSIVQDFIDPEVWRQFSPANLTPWLIFSYELDLILFGFNPAAFYFHQLLALLAVAVVFYFVLSLWVNRVWALAGAALFVLGAPGITVVQQLMTRHYLEGLLFCLMALLLYVRFLRGGHRLLLLASVVFYVMSVTAKEVYVPLVVLLPFLPEASFSERAKATVPFMAIALLYTVWRFYMLGTATGGYVESSDYLSVSFMGQVLASLAGLPALMFATFWPVAMTLYVMLILLHAYLYRSRLSASVSIFLLVLSLTLLPLVPLVSSPGISLADRYLLLPWLVMCFSLAFFADRLVQYDGNENKIPVTIRSAGIGIGLALIMIITISAGLAVKKTVVSVATEYDVQADFILANGSSQAFIPSPNVLTALWFVTDLAEVKSRLTAGTSPQAVIDQLFLPDDVDSLVAYDAECQCMQGTTLPTTPKRDDAPLNLQFSYHDRTFSWQFGPYDRGSYQVVSPNFGVIPVPQTGRIKVTLADADVFYLRYTSAEGWATYSDQQTIQSGAGNVHWRRE